MSLILEHSMAVASKRRGLPGLGLTLATAIGIAVGCAGLVEAAEPVWRDQGPGLSYYCDSNPRIPLTVHVVRIDRSQKDLEFYTTLGGENQIGMAVLSEQVGFIKPEI